MDDNNETELKRRDVLKRGAATTSAFIVGGTAVSGAAAGQSKKQGGKALVSTASGFEFKRKTPWRVARVGAAVEHHVTCQAGEGLENESEVKDWQDYFIEYADGGDSLIAVPALRSNRIDETGNQWYEFTTSHECRSSAGQNPFIDLVRASFKPAKSP